MSHHDEKAAFSYVSIWQENSVFLSVH